MADQSKSARTTLIFICAIRSNCRDTWAGSIDIIRTPVVYDNKVYFATGQDPEHGEGLGIFWCVDPTKRGDISEKIVKNRAPAGSRGWSGNRRC